MQDKMCNMKQYQSYFWDTVLYTVQSSSVVVETLAGLLEVAITSLCLAEPQLAQVLPLEEATAQLLPLRLGAGPLGSQQLDVAGKRDSPSSQVPRYMPCDCYGSGHTQGRVFSINTLFYCQGDLNQGGMTYNTVCRTQRAGECRFAVCACVQTSSITLQWIEQRL